MSSRYLSLYKLQSQLSNSFITHVSRLLQFINLVSVQVYRLLLYRYVCVCVRVCVRACYLCVCFNIICHCRLRHIVTRHSVLLLSRLLHGHNLENVHFPVLWSHFALLTRLSGYNSIAYCSPVNKTLSFLRPYSAHLH